MTLLDTAVVIGSLAGLVIVAARLALRQRETADYYLAGRRLPAWAMGASLAANQVSAISLIGAPAFVALRPGGGLTWLQYELAVPLAMAVLVVWGVPFLRRAGGASVYAAVEARLGRQGRRTAAWLFLAGRGGGAGVILYASALVVDAVTGWGLGASLLVVGVVALAYTALGGLAADVITDVLQLGLLWGGTLAAGVALALRLHRDGALALHLDPERLRTLDLAGHGLGDGATFAFWPMLLGGFFLYLSYYGCDQTQAQRLLAARSPADARSALATAAWLRFPLVATYCAFGVLLAVLLQAEPAFAARLAGRPPDALVPEFIAWALPAGVRGVAVAGILAAALSSLDSALNSLSAVTLEEVLPRRWAASVWVARLTTVAWGSVTVAAAFAFARAGETTIELVNRVGSAVYGPTLALFAVAYLASDHSARVALPAAAGVASALTVGWLTPQVSWFWWNVLGFGVTAGLAVLSGRPGWRPSAEPLDGAGHRTALRLVLLFAAILATLAVLQAVAAA